MAYALENVVPWGRSLNEYASMFELTDREFATTILGCADGPASFNAELTQAGGKVVSFDPIYEFSEPDIRGRITDASAQIIEHTRQHVDEFIWSREIPDPDTLARHRLATMERFLEDYDVGRREGRYITGELPELPFSDGKFNLAVCSHFLFLYSEQVSAQFHVNSIHSLLRVAKQTRVFPLVELGCRPSRHLESVVETLRNDGLIVEIKKVEYEFQRGGDQMMKVSR